MSPSLFFQSQIMFYNDCVKGLISSNSREKLEAVHKNLLGQMNNLAVLVTLNTSNLRTKAMLAAVLTISVHCRDVVTDLLAKNISSAEDFEWTRSVVENYNYIQQLLTYRPLGSLLQTVSISFCT